MFLCACVSVCPKCIVYVCTFIDTCLITHMDPTPSFVFCFCKFNVLLVHVLFIILLVVRVELVLHKEKNLHEENDRKVVLSPSFPSCPSSSSCALWSVCGLCADVRCIDFWALGERKAITLWHTAGVAMVCWVPAAPGWNQTWASGFQTRLHHITHYCSLLYNIDFATEPPVGVSKHY